MSRNTVLALLATILLIALGWFFLSGQIGLDARVEVSMIAMGASR